MRACTDWDDIVGSVMSRKEGDGRIANEDFVDAPALFT